MGDPYKKVLPGQRLQFPAEAFNAFLEAARDVRGRRHNHGGRSGEEFRQTGIVTVRNQTGASQPRFAIVALRAPIIVPTAKLREFKNRVSFNGVIPESPARCERFAVLLEPLKAGAIGRGVVAGVTIVRLEVIHENDSAAEPVAGVAGHLRGTPYGQTRVLWKEPGLGLKWAVVRLGDRPRWAIFQLSGQWLAAVPPEPDGWAKMEGCKPVLYLSDAGTYAADASETGETIWHALGYPPTERAALRSLHQTTGLFPAKVGCGDWVWCMWNEHECRWQALAPYEDHWRFRLTAPLARCGSASADLVLYQTDKWCPVPLTFTVHDSLGVVCPDICNSSCIPPISSVPAGTFGVAKHYADSCKWEVLVLGKGCASGCSLTQWGTC